MSTNKQNTIRALSSRIFRKLRQPQQSQHTTTQSSTAHDPAKEFPILSVYHQPTKLVVARVILNGYNIDQGEVSGSLGAMRSFKIVQGDLWDEWNAQTAVILADDRGKETLVKVAALPADEDSFGLIEFVSTCK